MKDIDLAGLREIAGKATPGRWVFSPDDGSALDADAVLALDDSGEEVSTVTAWLDANDAAHIAAFDPTTVLAMLDRIEEQQAELDVLRDQEAVSTIEWATDQVEPGLPVYPAVRHRRSQYAAEMAVSNLESEARRVLKRVAIHGPWVEVSGV